MNTKHSKSRSDKVFKMSTNFRTSSSVRNMKSTADAENRRISFRARVRCNAQFATMLAHDASSSISTSNSDERYGIPKSDEFRSLVKYDVWFCDSWASFLYSNSIHWQILCCHQCTHCEVARVPDAFSYCQRFSILLTTRNRPTFARQISNKFVAQ